MSTPTDPEKPGWLADFVHGLSFDEVRDPDQDRRLDAIQAEELPTPTDFEAMYRELAASLDELDPGLSGWGHKRACTWIKREGRGMRSAYDRHMAELWVERKGRLAEIERELHRLVPLDIEAKACADPAAANVTVGTVELITRDADPDRVMAGFLPGLDALAEREEALVDEVGPVPQQLLADLVKTMKAHADDLLGGYMSEPELGAFRHGMQTMIRLVEEQL